MQHFSSGSARITSIGYWLGMLIMLLTVFGCTVAPTASPKLRIDTSALQAAPAAPAVTTAPATTPLAASTAPVAVTPEPPAKPAKPRPASYAWNPGKARKGPVTVVVSLSDQKAYVYRNGVKIAYSQVSTGKRGYETPTGSFKILQKRKKHKSNLYEDGDMPYMQRLTWDGIALHGGRVPNRPASHGCIRFPHRFASKLYGITGLGSRVVIQDYHPGDELI